MELRLTNRSAPWAFAGLAAISLFASASAIAKYAHPRFAGLLLYLVLFVCIVSLPSVAKLRIAQSRWVLIACLAVFFAEAIFLYPIADARKFHGGGSTQDDALVQAADQLRGGKYPYRFPVYDGGPISDGPGWVILHMPMHPLRVYALENPVLFAILAWLLRKRDKRSAFLFLAFLMLTPVVHLLVIDGSDLPALSAAIFFLCLSIYKRTNWASALWIVLCGFIITARVNLIVLPGVMLMMRRDWKTAKAWVETIAATLIAASLHFIFYRISPAEYAPFHLLGKAHAFVASTLGLAIVCYLLALALVVLFKARTGAQMAVLTGVFLFLAHVPVAIGSLHNYQDNLALWQGYEYISLCLICLSAGVALVCYQDTNRSTEFIAQP